MVSELRSAKWAKGWEGSRGESRLLLEHTEIAESLQPWRSWRGTMMLQEDLILSNEASQERFPCGLKGAGFSQLFFDDSPSQAGWENGVWPFRVVEMSNLICVCVCVCIHMHLALLGLRWGMWTLSCTCEIYFPDKGSNPGLLRWEYSISATGPPGKVPKWVLLIDGEKDLRCLCWKGPGWGWKVSWIKLTGRGFEEEPVHGRGDRTGTKREALVVTQVQAGEKTRGLHSRRSCWVPGKRPTTPTLGILVLIDAWSLQLVRKDKMKLLTAWGLYTSASLQRGLLASLLYQFKS